MTADSSRFIMGYSDRLSVREGDDIAFYTSCSEDMDYRVELVRIICGDTNPEGPGLKIESVASSLDRTCSGRPQLTRMGSYARVEGAPSLLSRPAFGVSLWLYPTTPAKGEQSIIEQTFADRSCIRLGVSKEGSLLATVLLQGHPPISLSAPRRLHGAEWYFATFACDLANGRTRLTQRPLNKMLGEEVESRTEFPRHAGRRGQAVASTSFAAGLAPAPDGKHRPHGHFNGRIEEPTFYLSGETWSDPAGSAVGLDLSSMETVASWDFSIGIQGNTVQDTCGSADGILVNLPTRAVTGRRWTGDVHDWRAAPDQYAAIHFHDDDLYDAEWEEAFRWTVPRLQSGLYAAHLSSDGLEDYIPFYVCPGPGSRTSDVAFLAPTASYLAYANDHSPTNAHFAEVELGQVTPLSMTDLFLNEHRELGASLYDTHSDGSGVVYSSRLRPILTMRPKCIGWLGGVGSSLWQFNADTHILSWLDHHGISTDMVTDEDLERVSGTLDGYRVLLTGTHPEYFSAGMRSAVDRFLEAGGRLMYLGGNGWYWKIAFSDAYPGAIEVRRAEGGLRAWEARPGEYYQSFDGAYGGLWRRQGMAPQATLGVGFSAQGFDVSSYYRRNRDSLDPRAEFIFRGLGDKDTFGNVGLTGGGAAGLELDRADRSLGTPRHALVLASSADHTDTYVVVPEEILINTATLTGTQSPLVRSDIVFFETPYGGAVFSVGSIAWSGSLPVNDYQNDVSTITLNVLTRFMDETPFALPEI